jgi:hypothetical protein
MEFEVWGWFFVAMGLQASWVFVYERGLNRGANNFAEWLKKEWDHDAS